MIQPGGKQSKVRIGSTHTPLLPHALTQKQAPPSHSAREIKTCVPFSHLNRSFFDWVSVTRPTVPNTALNVMLEAGKHTYTCASDVDPRRRILSDAPFRALSFPMRKGRGHVTLFISLWVPLLTVYLFLLYTGIIIYTLKSAHCDAHDTPNARVSKCMRGTTNGFSFLASSRRVLRGLTTLLDSMREALRCIFWCLRGIYADL